MGCETYTLVVDGISGLKVVDIHFSDSDDTVGCLCTFPGNDRAYLKYNHYSNTTTDKFDDDTIKSLAMLGAAVKLAYNDELEGWIGLPFMLPNDIRAWIENYFKEREKIDGND